MKIMFHVQPTRPPFREERFGISPSPRGSNFQGPGSNIASQSLYRGGGKARNFSKSQSLYSSRYSPIFYMFSTHLFIFLHIFYMFHYILSCFLHISSYSYFPRICKKAIGWKFPLQIKGQELNQNPFKSRQQKHVSCPQMRNSQFRFFLRAHI